MIFSTKAVSKITIQIIPVTFTVNWLNDDLNKMV